MVKKKKSKRKIQLSYFGPRFIPCNILGKQTTYNFFYVIPISFPQDKLPIFPPKSVKCYRDSIQEYWGCFHLSVPLWRVSHFYYTNNKRRKKFTKYLHNWLETRELLWLLKKELCVFKAPWALGSEADRAALQQHDSSYR